MNLFDNIILLTDSYKVSHYKQYPDGVANVYSYFESRGGAFKDTVFFGLHYYLKQWLSKPITQENIEEAAEFWKDHFGSDDLFNREGWEYILREYDGFLPVSIKAIPEGTVVNTSNALYTIENTDPNCYWLTNYLETLLCQVWHACTVATVSREMKKIILDALKKSGDPSTYMFKLHDFGFRGVECVEAAGLGGAAHLINFLGTDTVPALIVAKKIYGHKMAGFSIAAAEHSTITSWGRANEVEACRNMLVKYPKGLVAVVSDSYDIYNACANIWGGVLKDLVMAREGTLVIRPDSGDPCEVLPKILDILGEKFGYTVNAKGYKVLDPHVRVIQGDSVDLDTLGLYLDAVMNAGWSADNLAFGSGGGLLQKVNRDTAKFAFKCSNVTVDGEDRDVYKEPIDTPWKKSKKGRFKLAAKPDGTFVTISMSEMPKVQFDITPDSLVEVFRNGKILVHPTFDQIRERAEVK